MTIIIAGERSGVGKTTITLSILAFLAQQKLKVQSFKVGPDYIDPMFHTWITGGFCRNLDPLLTSENYVKSCYSFHCQNRDYSIIEGVMGLYDGVSFPDYIQTKSSPSITDFGSTAHIARILNLPVILVVDCSKLSNSVAAIIHGYSTFDPHINIAGVILNKLGSDRHLQIIKNALKSIPIPIVGVFYRQDSITLSDRHLGLIPTDELTNLKNLCEELGNLAQKCLNWDILLPLLKVKSKSITVTEIKPKTSIKIGIAKDKAFNFYYQDNLDLLQQLGAEIIEFSVLKDNTLPEGINGLYFGGGFPEIFAQELAENKTIKTQIIKLIKQGIPTYSECGGLMYLCQELIDFEEKKWTMLGILPATTKMGGKLTLGYRQATTLQDSILLKKNEQIWGHEFHRSSIYPHSQKDLQNTLFMLQNLYHPQGIEEGWRIYNTHNSYLHLHWGDKPHLAQRWLNFCQNYHDEYNR
jgi:cobyrinic acid a,c-diamide synthase